MEIEYSENFFRLYKKIPKNIRSLFKEKESIFKVDIFDKKLKTHKLHGKLSDFYSFSINYKYRVIFKILNNKVRVVFIGKHDIYYKID